MKLTYAAALAAAGCLALSGCSGDDDNTGDKSPRDKDSGTTGVISPTDLPKDAKLKQPTGIMADADVKQCTTDPGPARAAGTVTNSGKTAKDLVITNTGTTRLTDVGVDDPMLTSAGVAVSCPRDTLRPGQTMVCESAAYTITGADVAAGGVRNVATATATPPGGGKLTSDDSTVTVSTKGASGDLPDTGAGFTWWMPLAGLGLLAIGFALILAKPGKGRRRKA